MSLEKTVATEMRADVCHGAVVAGNMLGRAALYIGVLTLGPLGAATAQRKAYQIAYGPQDDADVLRHECLYAFAGTSGIFQAEYAIARVFDGQYWPAVVLVGANVISAVYEWVRDAHLRTQGKHSERFYGKRLLHLPNLSA
jgi:hypothetical protein